MLWHVFLGVFCFLRVFVSALGRPSLALACLGGPTALDALERFSWRVLLSACFC